MEDLVHSVCCSLHQIVDRNLGSPLPAPPITNPEKSLLTYLRPGGGIFDTGPGFVFNVGGGPGIRVHQFGGQRPRRRPATAQGAGQQEATPNLASTISSLLPLLILFVIPLLSSIFSGSSEPAGPSVRFQSTPPYTQLHTSYRLKVPYYVNPREVADYGRSDSRSWKKLDLTAESNYMYILQNECHTEELRQARMFQDAQGWFFTDEDKLRKAREMPMASCKRLGELSRGKTIG